MNTILTSALRMMIEHWDQIAAFLFVYGMIRFLYDTLYLFFLTVITTVAWIGHLGMKTYEGIRRKRSLSPQPSCEV